MYLELSDEDQQLIDRIKKRVYRDPQRATTMAENYGSLSDYYPPVTYDQIEAAEKAIGFPLPALIRELYVQVGNGGFGPGYGITGLENGFDIYGETLVRATLLNREYREKAPEYDEVWDWEDSYLMYGYWGCNVTTVVDCSPLILPIYCVDAGDWGTHSSRTVRRWWQDWLDDKVEQY
jgi:hypothetical protein